MGSNYTDLKKALIGRMERYDEKVNSRFKEDGLEITCKRGCSHCCYLLTTIHPLEGLLLAEEVLKRPHWRRRAAKLSENAHACNEAGSNRAKYFAKGIPCPFLDLKTNDCEVYRFRPAPCRYHFVISPVERCFRTYNGAEISTPDTTVVLADVLKYCMDSTQMGAAAPIALMVLWCMEEILGGKDNKNFVKRLREGLPHPLEWLKKASKTWDFEADTNDYKVARRRAFTQVFGKEATPYFDVVVKAREKAHA